ncbi:MAG: hypothetical protein ACRCZO_02975, partial [Cetobacterium sp.]
MSKETYSYEWYEKGAKEYKELYKKDFDLKNKFFLLAVGGTIAVLVPLLDKFGKIIKLFLLLEISFLIILGFLVLYSLLKEVEVHEKYIENYDKVYESYGEEEITEENSKESTKILNDNKFYDESIKNEKNIKKFFKLIIGYTILLLTLIFFKEAWEVIGEMCLKNKDTNKVQLYDEGVKPNVIKKPTK